jgi:hypothetical protein
MWSEIQSAWSADSGRKIGTEYSGMSDSEPEGIQTVVGNSRRRGRPAKAIDLGVVIRRRKNRESLRSIAAALGVSHSTLLDHLKRSEFIEGFDY